MRYWVACTIKTVNTDLACDVEIGHLRKGSETGFYKWAKFAGRLDIESGQGTWMYRVDEANKVLGVTLCRTSDTKDPYFNDPANYLVELNGAPKNFAEKIGCGGTLGGYGHIYRTNEEIAWQMWYPCA